MDVREAALPNSDVLDIGGISVALGPTRRIAFDEAASEPLDVMRSEPDVLAPLGDSASTSESTASGSRFIKTAGSRSPLLAIEGGAAPKDLARASASSLAVWNRRFGSRSSALKNHASNELGMPGRRLEGTGTAPVAIAAKVIATPCSMFHTGRPVRHSNAMHPSAQRSA